MVNHPTVTARSTLGVPFIPPAAISEQSTRFRSALSRLHRALAPPPVQILESALSLLDHRVLVALCESGVPDAIDGPTSVPELAEALGLDPDRLDRLVRFGASRGWLKIGRNGQVKATKTTAFLRNDHPAGWRAWVDFVAGDHIVNAVGALALDGPGHGFAAVNGKPIFDWFHDHPTEWATFDAAMAAGGRMHALMLDAAINWRTTAHICDVGGGTGELVRTLLDRHTDWHGTVFDLPKVIERAVEHPRLSAVPGDAFVSVPAGHDCYLLVNVLHDWSDDDSLRLLSSVAAACSADTRVIVLDNCRRNPPRDDLALRADVLMAALTGGGRERSIEEFTALGQRAGMRLVTRKQLGSGDHAFEFQVTNPATPHNTPKDPT
ncbi:MAG TPA: methyltransferase [Ilumatobacter sp.]|nr:methyltransferase [Ilumatobacter sp.]